MSWADECRRLGVRLHPPTIGEHTRELLAAIGYAPDRIDALDIELTQPGAWVLSNHTVGMGGSTLGTTGPGYGFGIGFGVRLDEGMGWTAGSKGDAMWAGAWGTSFWIDPKEKLVAVLMAQAPSHRVPNRMLYKNLVYSIPYS